MSRAKPGFLLLASVPTVYGHWGKRELFGSQA